MSISYISSANHRVPLPLHCDATKPEHGTNLRTVQRVVADAVRSGLSGTVTMGDFNSALANKVDISTLSDYATIEEMSVALNGKVDTTDSRLANARTPLAHAASHYMLGGDRLSPSDIGAMSPPPGDGKLYLVTGSGYVEYIAPEIDAGGIVTMDDHAQLKNLDAANAHPISSIQHLEPTLADIRTDIDGLCATAGTLSLALADKADVGHSHGIGDVSGLNTALLAKADQTALDGYATKDELAGMGGGIDVWQDDKHYAPPKLLFGRDNNLYKVLSENGRGTDVGVRDPAAEPVRGGVKIEGSSATLPSSASWVYVAFGNGVFVAVTFNSNKAAYSIDNGKTWTAATLPSAASWRSVTFGNGVFVAVAADSNKAAYSTDNGKTWTATTLPATANWYSVTFGNDVFVAVAYDSNQAAYSIDNGKTWVSTTLPTAASWASVIFGNDVFVAVAFDSNQAAYSIDNGKTWVSTTLPAVASWRSITFGNDVFVVVTNGSDQAAYSIDNAKTWTATTLPAAASWFSVTFGNDVFVAVAYDSNQAAYSIDNGKTWVSTTLPAVASWRSITFGNDVFVAVALNSNIVNRLSFTPIYLPNCWKLVG